MLDGAEREPISRENVIIDTSWPQSLREVAPDTLNAIINKQEAHQACLGTGYPRASQEPESNSIGSFAFATAEIAGAWEKTPGSLQACSTSETAGIPTGVGVITSPKVPRVPQPFYPTTPGLR